MDRPRFLALPVLTLRCNRAEFVPLLRRRPLLFEMRPFLFYLLLGGAAAGGASIHGASERLHGDFPSPVLALQILNQLPWMVLSLTVTE